jgi:hypothetical protein
MGTWDSATLRMEQLDGNAEEPDLPEIQAGQHPKWKDNAGGSPTSGRITQAGVLSIRVTELSGISQ